MAGVNWGEALAQGIAQGVGEGAQDYFKDQRRERMELRQMDKSFDMFKKQQRYQMGLQGIQAQNEALGSWEQAAKMNVGDLAYQAAVKMAEPLSKDDRAGFIRDTMKNFGGMSKAELLVRAGYSKPDYSQWIDNPEYQDAIPMSRVAGMEDMPDMTQVFKYDPRRWEQEQKKEQEKITDYMRKKQDTFNGIKSMSVVQFGATPSEELTNVIWQQRPGGVGVEMKGADAISYDQNLLTSLINSGQVVQVGTQLKLKGELTDADYKIIGGQPTAAPQQPQGKPGALYTEPTTEKYLGEQEQKEEMKVQRQAASKVEKDQGKTIKSYTSLNDLENSLASLSDDAKAILFGDTSLKGLLSMSKVGQQIAAKQGVKGAEEARKFLALMENISATLKHEQYGSAQTATELKNFADQLGNPSILQNPKTLLDQIKTRKQLIGSALSASVGETGRKAYMAEHPDMEAVLGQVFGGGENGQVSDLSGQPKVVDAQGKDVSANIPEQFWKASPEKQKQFLTKYGLTLGGN